MKYILLFTFIFSIQGHSLETPVQKQGKSPHKTTEKKMDLKAKSNPKNSFIDGYINNSRTFDFKCYKETWWKCSQQASKKVKELNIEDEKTSFLQERKFISDCLQICIKGAKIRKKMKEFLVKPASHPAEKDKFSKKIAPIKLGSPSQTELLLSKQQLLKEKEDYNKIYDVETSKLKSIPFQPKPDNHFDSSPQKY